VWHPQDLPTHDIPSFLDHTNEVKPLRQVSNIKAFLQSYIKLLNEQSSIKNFQNMIEKCNLEVEGKLE